MYTAEASVNVAADPQTAWDYVSNYQNFDQFMPHITKVQILEGDTSEWHLSGPLGIPVSWQAITSVKQPPSHLSWHSVKGTIDTKGFIKIEPSSTGSRITVHMEYEPPLGAIGEAFASLFKDPQKMLEDGVEKLGQILHGGDVHVKDKDETRQSEANRGMTDPSGSAPSTGSSQSMSGMNQNMGGSGMSQGMGSSGMGANGDNGGSNVGNFGNIGERRNGTGLTEPGMNDSGDMTHGDPSLAGSSLNDSSMDRDLEGDRSGNVKRSGGNNRM
jgi:ribosome-associated toxin RatA of RatAB toxin-antitoxin module